MTVRYPDGSSKVVKPGHFAKRKFSYKRYLHSSGWKERRRRALERDDHRCAICRSTEKLEVHHRTYERLGRERLDDLVTLCQPCHAVEHQRLRRVA